MKIFLTISVQLIFCVCSAVAQIPEEFNDLTQLDTYSIWSKEIKNNEIRYLIVDTFQVCEDLSPLRRDGFIDYPPDTISLTILFEQGWTEEIKDSIRKGNLRVFNLIHNRLISHFDSSGTYASKTIQYEELKNCIPCSYEVWFYLDDWTNEELNKIKSVHPLPDYITNGYGVFNHLNYNCVESKNLQYHIDELIRAYESTGRDKYHLRPKNNY